MASRDKVDVDMSHKGIQYALEKLGKSKSGFTRTAVSNFKSKNTRGSGNELVDYSRVLVSFEKIYQKTVFRHNFKEVEVCQKHCDAHGIFNCLQGVWICGKKR